MTMKNFILYTILTLAYAITWVKVNGQVTSDSTNAHKYLPTLLFKAAGISSGGETNFPHRMDFNTSQDANNDGLINMEDAMENLIRYTIDTNVYGTGRTGITGRGPNDQGPAVYFNLVDYDSIRVYQYWFYYADNDWINNHEHDWQYYYVYEQCGIPTHILLNYHNYVNWFKWDDLPKDDGHPVIGVEGGSHGFQNKNRNGVKIRYNGDIYKRAGTLNSPDSINIPWKVFSTDSLFNNVIPYSQTPDSLFKGDPYYALSTGCEYCDAKENPWLRTAWLSPPLPTYSGNCQGPEADFDIFGSDSTFIFLDSSKYANSWFWDFGDGTTSQIQQPMHTFQKSGQYRVCLSVLDSCKVQTDCICKTLNVGSTTINPGRNYKDNVVNIYPNPVKDKLYFELGSSWRDNISITITDLTGRLLKKKDYSHKLKKLSLNMTGFPKGLLLVKLHGSERIVIKRVIRQ